MANIFEKARAERAYHKYVKGLESVAGPTPAGFSSLPSSPRTLTTPLLVEGRVCRRLLAVLLRERLSSEALVTYAGGLLAVT
jgi:hypothetical protein